MDPRRHHPGATPGSGGSDSGGNGGRSVYGSSRRRRRMSSTPTGTRLMPRFNAAVDGGAFRPPTSASFSGGLDLGLDGSHHRRSVHLEASPTPNHAGRVLLLSPVVSPAATDDDVLIMDGVLVDNNGSGTPSSGSGARHTNSSVESNGSGTRRAASISDNVFVSSGSRVSIGSGSRSGSNGQVIREEPRGIQAMKPRFSEVGVGSPATPGSRPAFGAGPSNMQGSSITPPSPLPGPALPTAAGAVTIRPSALSYFTPPRVTVRRLPTVAKPDPPAPKQPERKPPPPTRAFSWPPTTAEEAAIAQKLYGARGSGRPRLLAFRDICNDEDKASPPPP